MVIFFRTCLPWMWNPIGTAVLIWLDSEFSTQKIPRCRLSLKSGLWSDCKHPLSLIQVCWMDLWRYEYRCLVPFFVCICETKKTFKFLFLILKLFRGMRPNIILNVSRRVTVVFLLIFYRLNTRPYQLFFSKLRILYFFQMMSHCKCLIHLVHISLLWWKYCKASCQILSKNQTKSQSYLFCFIHLRFINNLYYLIST